MASSKKVTKAVIPAAGFGTRFLPATKAQPKEMLPIVDKPVIQFVVEEAVNAGLDDILIITGRGKRAIEDHFDRNVELEELLRGKQDYKSLEALEKIEKLADIHYVRQKEAQGLGHAVMCAQKHVDDEPFVVLLGDTIVKANACTKPLVDIYSKHASSVVAVEEVPKGMVSQYGVIGGKKFAPSLYKVDKFVEKPLPAEAPSNLAIFGRYLLTPEIFGCLKETKPGKGGEIQLTDGLELLRQKQDVLAFEISEKRYDIGKRMQYFKAFVEFGLEREDIGKEAREYLKSLKL
ncbi:MAG: UTP--glucose-1-phosphate uridylyltransferase GalU [Candidatus Micrarchaeia archaeon]